MLSENLLKELNLQVKYELFSANLYLAMAAYCADQQLDGFENFFKVQAEEEKFHAMLIFDFINEMGGRVHMMAMEEPQNEYKDVEEVFAEGLNHEKFVTSRIYKLMDIAMDEREHNTISFLKWFIDEQREEETMFDGYLKQIQRFGQAGLYHIDKEMATRVFTPPVIN